MRRGTGHPKTFQHVHLAFDFIAMKMSPWCETVRLIPWLALRLIAKEYLGPPAQLLPELVTLSRTKLGECEVSNWAPWEQFANDLYIRMSLYLLAPRCPRLSVSSVIETTTD